jgi:PadR family transcriptional regulator PadR
MANQSELTELRRGVLASCVLALLQERPRFGLEIVRDLAELDGLLTSEGTVYPLLTRLTANDLVTSLWRHDEGQRARRYYSITRTGQARLGAFREEWAQFTRSVDSLLYSAPLSTPERRTGASR